MNGAQHPTAAAGRPYRAFPLHVHIASLFGVLMAVAVIVVSAFHHHQTRNIVLTAHETRFAELSTSAVASLEQTRDQTTRVVDLLSRSDLTHHETLVQRLEGLNLLHEVLRLDPSVTALLVGYTDGDYLRMRPLAPQAGDPRAPPSTRFVVESVERARGEADQGRLLYYDQYLNLLSIEVGTTLLPEPRVSDWYREAINHDVQVALLTPAGPHGDSPSAIFARRSVLGRSVVAAEVGLTHLGEAVTRLESMPSARVALLADSRPIFHRSGAPSQAGAEDLLALLARAGATGKGGQATAADDGGALWRLSRAELPGLGATRLELVLAVPEADLFVEADTVMRQSLWISFALLALALPLTWVASRLVAQPLRLLAAEARAVQEFRFSSSRFGHSIVTEVDEVGSSLGAMQRTIHRFFDTGRSLSSEHDHDRLVERVLDEALDAANLVSGVLYLLSHDESEFQPALARRAGELLAPPAQAGFGVIAAAPEGDLLATLRSGRAKTLPILGGLAPAVAATLSPFSAPRGAEAGCLLAVPLQEPGGVLIGALWLHLPRDATPPAPDRLAFLEALADVAAIALQNHRLLESRKRLLDAVVAVVAGAIDAKSPHTGGHCQRVPALLEMLADAACRADWGPFADFHLDARGWEALRMAGWLHDCGKVTTPEYVIDKGTKLETLYNRLNEIRMRFELLKRDAQITYWRMAAERGGSNPEMDLRLARLLTELDEEFAFVAHCNVGGESLSDDDRQRLALIGRRTWQRTLDDTLGLSWEERSRKPSVAPALPVTEPLLADKPEHLVPHHDTASYAPGNPWGFRVTPPSHRLNLGELHNLGVGRGTLTAEERHLINDHIVQTIVMLSRLPFPRELTDVPEIAGGHHERMDGQGYPRRVRATELSLPARMLALADVFEALTAGDRPYKRGKTVDEAVAMLRKMAGAGHLDGDVLELALRGGVFERYAERFLPSAADRCA